MGELTDALILPDPRFTLRCQQIRGLRAGIFAIGAEEKWMIGAKVAQEKLIEASGIPYTIIRSTQFLEFLGAIAARRLRPEHDVPGYPCALPSPSTILPMPSSGGNLG